MENKNTIIINLFGGPGTGKSTAAAYIFSRLKMHGIDCEYVTEFAKDKVWENNVEVFKNQFYIGGKQCFRISRCCGKVDVIITDSPILLSAVYEKNNKYLKFAVVEEFNKHKNVNILLKRDVPYQENGRNQNENEAKEIDNEVEKTLGQFDIDFTVTSPSIKNYEDIVKSVLTFVNKNKRYISIEEELNK